MSDLAARREVAGGAFLFLSLIVLSSIVLVTMGGHELEPKSRDYIESAMLAQGIASVGILVLATFWRTRAPLIGRQRILSSVGLYFLFLVAWIPLAFFFVPWLWQQMGLTIEPQAHLDYFTGPLNPVGFTIVAIAVTLVGPALEEVIFRGHIQTGLTDQIGKWPALLLASFLFGLIHVGSGWHLLLPIGALGLFFGWVRIRAGGLAAPIVVHALHNGLTVAITVSQPELMDSVMR